MRRAAVAALLLLGLAGCSARPGDSAIPACPRIGILADASRIVVFRDGPGRDLSDVVYEAELAGVTGECVYDRRRTNVTVDMRLRIDGLRGPADRTRAADLTYFVAVLDKQSAVLARQEFRSRLEFPLNIARIATVEELEQKMVLAKDQPGSDFEILVGFKLSPDQLERNRTGLR